VPDEEVKGAEDHDRLGDRPEGKAVRLRVEHGQDDDKQDDTDVLEDQDGQGNASVSGVNLATFEKELEHDGRR